MLLYRVHAGYFDTFESYYLYSGSSDWRECFDGKSSKFTEQLLCRYLGTDASGYSFCTKNEVFD